MDLEETALFISFNHSQGTDIFPCGHLCANCNTAAN